MNILTNTASLVLIIFSTSVFSADKTVTTSKVINKYGFKSVGTTFDDCRKINQKDIKKIKKCYFQGRKRDTTGKKHYSFTQYKCSLGKANGEIFIYNTKRACHRQYNSMVIESN